MQYISYPIIDMKKTGENIRRIRMSCGLEVKDVQHFLGLASPCGIYLWQKGYSLPSVDHLCAISKLFRVAMDDIIVLQDPYLPNVCVSMADTGQYPTYGRVLPA